MSEDFRHYSRCTDLLKKIAVSGLFSGSTVVRLRTLAIETHARSNPSSCPKPMVFMWNTEDIVLIYSIKGK